MANLCLAICQLKVKTGPALLPLNSLDFVLMCFLYSSAQTRRTLWTKTFSFSPCLSVSLSFPLLWLQHNAQNHLWNKLATPFQDMQRNQDLSHISKEARSSWLVSALTASSDCGTAYEEFVKSVLAASNSSECL